ncbi:hypothetical protein [Mesorhizobium sp. M6A.T.Ce.TU.016.01.1.1]|uniref:hypothetical protein n=1 Tax=Mesorhizobium sp. M6A.T.Ce.TU.016.01.1.1 TaxID=2496783 RepID=UPI001FE1FDD9|nr:hypothetical protein [Mesorhizobium sp. M6A.T.Ce.TU.016.01.1.1]
MLDSGGVFPFCSYGKTGAFLAERERMYRQGEFDFGIPAPPWQPKRPDHVFFGLFLQQKDYSPFSAVQKQLCYVNGITGSLLLEERFPSVFNMSATTKGFDRKPSSLHPGQADLSSCQSLKSHFAMP